MEIEVDKPDGNAVHNPQANEAQYLRSLGDSQASGDIGSRLHLCEVQVLEGHRPPFRLPIHKVVAHALERLSDAGRDAEGTYPAHPSEPALVYQRRDGLTHRH